MSMNRKIYKKLLEWKNSKNRKPLILSGARQVGKTYSLVEFGRQEFQNLHYLNFQQNKNLAHIFEGDLSPNKIVESLGFVLNTRIEIDKDIIFFDEIQDCPRALTSLKYFCEDKPEAALCCAGSLLGVTYSNESFPVGKVNFLKMFPLSFEEFLQGIGDERGVDVLRNISGCEKIPAIKHEHLMEKLKEFMIVGGLPEIVNLYAQNQDKKYEAFEQVRLRQKELIQAYMGDFAKYCGKVKASDVTAVFESVPAQLSRENKKFKATDVIPSGRFSKLQSAIDWLVSAGLVVKVKIVNSGELPFSAFTKPNSFKLYLFDIGILGALAQLTPKVIWAQSELFVTFKGAFCENYVAQEFVNSGEDALYSWVTNTAEVEFLREQEGCVFPVEVKAGLSGKLKSLNAFVKKYPAACRVRLSGHNLEINNKGNMRSYPLYLAGRVPLKNHEEL